MCDDVGEAMSSVNFFCLCSVCVCVCTWACTAHSIAEPRTVFVSVFCSLTVLPTRPLVVPLKALHSDMLAGYIALKMCLP